MYHPAAALHQSSLRETLFADFRNLPLVLLRAREADEAARAPSVETIQVEAPSTTTPHADDSQLTLF